MFSQTTEYALRAIVYLAENPSPQKTEKIASATQIPPAYLSKVLQQLNRAAIVGSQRGLKGGHFLSRKPKKITILEIVNSVEPLQRIKECPLGLPAHKTQLCPLHKKLDEAAALIERSFGNTTVLDLITQPGNSNLYTFVSKNETKKKQKTSL